MNRIFIGIIAVLTLSVGLGIMVTGLVNAQNTTGAPTDFVTALGISFVLLGLSPGAVIFASFIKGKFNN